MLSIGIDIGYTSVKIVVINEKRKEVLNKYKIHKGDIRKSLNELLNDVLAKFDKEDIVYGGFTGSGSKLYTKGCQQEFIEEIPAIVEAAKNIDRNIKSVIHIGGQSSKFITEINHKNSSNIEISVNSNCAAGTGSFLEEQVSRMNLELEDYNSNFKDIKNIPRIAGRCSVFAKTDITHHQQEGVLSKEILLGLAYATINNYKGTVVRKLKKYKPLLLTGGVALNNAIIIAIKDIFKVKDEELIIPNKPVCSVAYGVASIALDKKTIFDIDKLLKFLSNKINLDNEIKYSNKEPLNILNKEEVKGKHICKALNSKINEKCFIGIDIGSTSTNLVLINSKKEILAYEYLKTYGEPLKAILIGLRKIKKSTSNNIEIVSSGITGSGRYMIGKMLGVDIIKDEITAQAKAAISIENDVDTIFEIGGQDSKFISIEDQAVVDFQMNKICAAGTGSFIEEQALKFNIPIEKFSELSLESSKPIDLGERCTVFMEASIASNISKGAKIKDISAGLCYSIAQNYLNKVVGNKKIGEKIFFQGGVAFNQGVINAFKNILKKDIIIPPFFSVTGAYGVGLIAMEQSVGKSTKFIGFDDEIESKLNIYKEKIKKNTETKFDKKVKRIIFKEYKSDLSNNKKTVGIPRALFTYGMFPLFNSFFEELGFNVLLSEESNEQTIKFCQEYSMEETCFPAKLLNGHIRELIEKKVDYILIPDLYTADHPESKSRKNYGCSYMQMAFKIIKQAMDLENSNIPILAPTFAPNIGADFMLKSFLSLGEKIKRNDKEIREALKVAFDKSNKFKEDLKKNAKENINSIDLSKKTFVIISKIYGVLDPVLNMGIANKLEQMGYNVISCTDLMECEIFDDYPNMFWPFSQHILSAAKYVRNQPNMFAVFLSHHGCGPDSVVSHYFRNEMKGKPYLSIEVDEHSSDVGIITRVEAFVNSIETYKDRKEVYHINKNETKKSKKIYLQSMYPYSNILKHILNKRGMDIEVLGETNKQSLEIGRSHTFVQEYFSLTALIGDVINQINKNKEEFQMDFMIYRTEGAEVEGQYSYLVDSILKEKFKGCKVIDPYLEDLVNIEEKLFIEICLVCLAGDLVMFSNREDRAEQLDKIIKLIENDKFGIDKLIEIAKKIDANLKIKENRKNIFAIGEINVLYNDFLNNNVLKRLEESNYKVIFASMSEYMWMIWKDSIKEKKENVDKLNRRLNIFKLMIEKVSLCFEKLNPFEQRLEDIESLAQENIGYYAGGNGRYRGAKMSSNLANIDGIINVNSMYENTGIAINASHRGFVKKNKLPMISMTFDGTENEGEKIKLNSFLYYL